MESTHDIKQSPFMRRHELSWVLLKKTDREFREVISEFPRMILHVIDTLLLRGAFSDGVTAIEVEENFGNYPDKYGPHLHTQQLVHGIEKSHSLGSETIHGVEEPQSSGSKTNPDVKQPDSPGSETKKPNPDVKKPDSPGSKSNPVSITVTHIGERTSFSDPNDNSMKLLQKLIASLPPSNYAIEANDGVAAVVYKQVSKIEPGRITFCPHSIHPSVDKTSWTKVVFEPDVNTFSIAYDELAIGRTVWKRCTDIAATLGLKVKMSGVDLIPQQFVEYVDRYPKFSLEKRPKAPKRIHEKVTTPDHIWEICIARSHGEFLQISFVNGWPTYKGGTHVDLVKATLTQYAAEVKQKLQVDFDMENICIFVNLTILKQPNFSINDDWLSIQFENNYELKFSKEFVEKFAESLNGLRPISLSQNISNLIDANNAGGEKSAECHLILTEGESAKKFALIGHDFLDKQFYGLLSIQGKIPNAKKKDSSIFDHEAALNIIASLGLEKGVCYKSVKKLRYGRLILMMDQDHDGSHIKGLIINMLHTFWPSLLKINFLCQFITPVIKVKVQIPDELHEFYSIPEFVSWSSTNGASTESTIRYCKGLASHDSEDATEYMKNKEQHVKPFKYSGPHDFNVINLAFSENRVHDRRQWLMEFEEGTFLDPNQDSITYSDFFNMEYILYSIEDIKRSIPSFVDGLKPSQRKALFSALNTGEVQAEKVESFAGGVVKQCQYHHGQNNMSDTIIGMAQKYIGTNNINLFDPLGIFGSRREGGKSSEARYLSIKLSSVVKNIFKKDDDVLLSHLVEDGTRVQPQWFLPIIPMSLVNGCEGIATGWSTKVPKYNPLEIIANLRRMLTREQTTLLVPWFNGFKGNVELQGGSESSYKISGKIVVTGPGKVEIIDFPPETKFVKVKSDLDLLVTNEKIKSYTEEHKEDDIKFVVEFTEEQFDMAKSQDFLKFFKLSSNMTADNMHLVDENGLVTRYSSPNEILSTFYDYRLPFYEKRKSSMLGHYTEKISKLENIIKYIKEYNDDSFSKSKKIRMQQLRERNYSVFPNDHNFSYISTLTIDDLDEENIDLLQSERKSVQELYDVLASTTPSDLWIADLNALQHRLELFYRGEITEDLEFHPRKKRRIA